MSLRLRLIVNPASGGGRCGRRLPGLVRRLQDRELDFRTHFTRSLQHASELAAEAAEVGEVAVAVGGDGVVSAVANGLAGRDVPATMGIVPGGRGNDFARWLGIQGIANSVATLAAGTSRLVDLGKVGETYFTCIASCGLDSEVMSTADNARFVRGPLTYPYAAARAILGWQPAKFAVEVDHVGSEFDGFSVIVANGGSYGGGMRMAPDASLDDGLFDVIFLHRVNRLRFMTKAIGVFKGTHINNPEVSVRRGTNVRLDADRPFVVYADGEPCGTTPTTVTMAAAALRVLAPPVDGSMSKSTS